MKLRDSKEAVKMAIETLRANKLRSGLTILGVVIGVATVITISSLINGVNNQVQAWVQSLGTNVLWAFHMPVIGVRPTAEMLARRKLTIDDAIAMRSLPHVVAVDPSQRWQNWQLGVGNVAVKFENRKMQNTILEGSSPEIKDVNELDIAEGRLFTEEENLRAANVVLLG